MEVVICKTKEEASKLAADMITAAVKKNPKAVLGLATGLTPVLMYTEMAKAVKAKKVSYKNVKSWNLDEYVGLAGTHDQSYRYFMNENLFKKIDIKLSNTHVLNGLASFRDYEFARYLRVPQHLQQVVGYYYLSVFRYFLIHLRAANRQREESIPRKIIQALVKQLPSRLLAELRRPFAEVDGQWPRRLLQ